MPLERAEEYLAAGAYVQARREVERLLSRSALAGGEQVRAYVLAAQSALGVQDLYGAATLAEKALAAATAHGDRGAEASARFLLGAAAALIGDPPQAEEHLLGFLALAEAGATVPGGWEARAHRHLGDVARQRRQWRQAAGAFERAAALAEDQAAALLLESAWCLLMDGSLSAAGQRLGETAAAAGEPVPPPIAATLLAYRALLHRLLGDLVASTALCQEVFTQGRPGVGAEAQAVAAWVTGENALDVGRREEAEVFANLAVSHAIQAKRPNLLNLVGDLRRRLLLSRPDENGAER